MISKIIVIFDPFTSKFYLPYLIPMIIMLIEENGVLLILDQRINFQGSHPLKASR